MRIFLEVVPEAGQRRKDCVYACLVAYLVHVMGCHSYAVFELSGV